VKAARYDLNIDRGGSFDFTLRVLDSLDEPVVLSGGVTLFESHIREGHRTPLVVALTVAPFPANDPDGNLRFSLTPEQTLLLDPNRKYVWDFFWTDPSGQRRKLLFGNANVDSNITHLS